MKRVMFFCFLGFHFLSFSQDEDAWVYFTDKLNVEASIANPISILTQKAIDRKNKHNVVIDERDVPVNEDYITELKNATGITLLAKSKWLNAVHVRGSRIAITEIQDLSFVQYIEYADRTEGGGFAKIASKKTSSKFESESIAVEYGYGDALNQIEMFNGDDLHLLGYTGSGVTIAVMDTGFSNVNTLEAFQRLREAGHIMDSYDFVNRNEDVYETNNSHGTRVLSTMAAYLEDEFVGTAPDASYHLFVTEDTRSENPVEESYWVEAVERADSLGVDIVNTSLGYIDYDNSNYTYSVLDMDGITTFITRGANIAFEKGLILVNSAGNSGQSGVTAPADSEYVISVGAVNAEGDYVSTSSIGSDIQPSQKPDIMAQGSATYIISESGAITTTSGTSFSSPIIAGGIACLYQALPEKSNVEIMQLVNESGSQYLNPDYQLGYGIPNLEKALNSVLSIESKALYSDMQLFPNPTRGLVYIKNIPLDVNNIKITFFDMLGKQVFNNFIINKNDSVDISFLPKGLYLAKIEGDHFSKTYKLVKT